MNPRSLEIIQTFLLFTALATAAAAAATPIKVFLLAGQSNLAGRGAASDLPVLVILTDTGKANSLMTHAATVRAAQRSVVVHDPRVALVDEDDLPLLDAVHYAASAQPELGARLGRAFFDRIPQAGR